MRKLFTVAGFLFVVACGKGGGDAGKIISEYGGYKDRLCKCADKACADKVAEEAEAWMGKQAESMEKMKPTKEQDEQFDKIENEMEACAKKFESAEAPPADPAMPPPADPAAVDPAAPADPAKPATP